MDLRKISERYSVAPQLQPEEMQAAADAGFAAVICNRPDVEVPGALQAPVMRQAAEAAGLEFHYLPLTHQTFTQDLVQRQRAIMDAAEKPVLAYCASGTRSTIAWALGQAGSMPVDDILSATRDGGYDLSTIRPTLEAASAG